MTLNGQSIYAITCNEKVIWGATVGSCHLLVIIVVPLVTEMNTPERSYKIYKFTLTISKLPVETKHNRATGDGLFL